MLAHYAGAFCSSDRLERAGRLIGPLVCTTPEEQQRFVGVYQRWRVRHERQAHVPSPGPARPTPAPSPPGTQPPVLPSRWMSTLGAFALIATLLALSFSVDGLKVSRPLMSDQWTVPDQLGGSRSLAPHRGAKIRSSDGTGVLRLAALLAPVIVFAVWLHWRLWARRIVKSRFPRDSDPGLNRFVGRGDAAERLFPPRALTVLREFRRIRAETLRDIDIERSVEATAQEGGRAVVIPRTERRERRYIALIETRANNDHAAHLAHALVTRMRERELDVDIYLFTGSPSSVVTADGREQWIEIEALSKRYANDGGARLLVFAEPELGVDAFDLSCAPWVTLLGEAHDCVLLPMRARQDLCEAFSRSGWIVVPRSLEGISRLPGMFALGPVEATSFGEVVGEGGLEPARWRHCADAPSRSLDALEDVLDLDSRVWLASLAVYPRLEHELSLHLGAELGSRTDRSTFDEARLRGLSRLDWLRQGAIPPAIRDVLLDRLPARERLIVRRLLYNVLGSALLDRPVPGQVTDRPDKRTRTVVRAFLRTRADGDPLVDRLSTRFLLFPRWGRRWLALPDRLARLLGFRVDAVPLTAVLLTLGAVIGLGWVVDVLETHAPAFNAWVTEHRMWVGIGVYVVTLISWSAFWTSVMLSPRFEKFTSELWRRRVRIDQLPAFDGQR